MRMQMVLCAFLLVTPPAEAPGGTRAFYALYEPMLRVKGEWPERYEQFRNGCVVPHLTAQLDCEPSHCLPVRRDAGV